MRLAKLLQQVENFYRTAVELYTLTKYGATLESPELLQSAEDLWDQTVNPTLATQLEQLIDSYRGFTQAMTRAGGEDVTKSPEQNADEDAESINDFVETMNARWQRIVENPYLQLAPDDDKYEESVAPNRFLEIAQSLVDNANNQLEQKASNAGLSYEDLKMMQEQQKAPPPTNQEEAAAAKRRSDVLEARRRYSRTFREKMKDVRKIGPGNLDRARTALQQQMETTNNLVEKEELAKRLKRLPNPESYYKYLETIRRNYQNAMSDPVRGPVIKQKALERKYRQRSNDEQMGAIIEAYKINVSNPATAAQAAANARDLIELEKEILERKGKNLDDPFILNDPMIQDMLKVDNIIRRHHSRTVEVVGKYRATEAEKIKKEFEYAGRKRVRPISLEGIIIQFKQSLPSIKMGIKKEITAKLRSVEKTKYGQYEDIINKAKMAGNQNEEMQAVKALFKVLNSDAESDPQVKKFVEYTKAFNKYLQDLTKLTSQENILSKDEIGELVMRGEQLLVQEQSRSGFRSADRKKSKLELAIVDIISQLKERLKE